MGLDSNELNTVFKSKHVLSLIALLFRVFNKLMCIVAPPDIVILNRVVFYVQKIMLQCSYSSE